MIPLCAFCSMFTVVALFFGGIVAWNVHAQRQQRLAFAAIAQRFGMTQLGPEHLRGSFGRAVLDVVLTTELRQRHGRRRSRRVRVTRYRVTPPAPLRMGLKLSSQSAFFGDIADALGLVSDLQVGRADLDGALRIGAADADHARRILRQDEVAMAALAAARLSRFYVRDDHASAQHDGWVGTPEQFEAFARPLGQLVDALAGARAHVRAGWEDEVDAAWGALAVAEGFTYAPHASMLSGTTPGGTPVQLRVETSDRGLITAARIQLARPLGLGLELYRTGVMQSLGALFGAQDLRLGIAALDDAFTIKAGREAEARQLLAELGGELTLLAQTFAELRVTDAGLEASQAGLLTDPRQASTLLRALVRVAQGLGGESSQALGVFR